MDVAAHEALLRPVPIFSNMDDSLSKSPKDLQTIKSNANNGSHCKENLAPDSCQAVLNDSNHYSSFHDDEIDDQSVSTKNKSLNLTALASQFDKLELATPTKHRLSILNEAKPTTPGNLTLLSYQFGNLNLQTPAHLKKNFESELDGSSSQNLLRSDSCNSLYKSSQSFIEVESEPDESQRFDSSLTTEEILPNLHPVWESNHNQLDTSFGPNQSKSSPGFAKVESLESGPDKSQRLDTSLATEEILPKSSPGFAKVETPESGPDKSQRLDTSLATEEILPKSHPVCESNHNQLDTSFGPNQSKSSPGFAKGFAKVETPESGPDESQRLDTSLATEEILPKSHSVCESNHNQLDTSFGPNQSKSSPGFAKVETPESGPDESQRLDTSLATEEILPKSHPVCESNHNQLDTSFGPNQSNSSPGYAKVETPESGPDKSQRLDTSLATEEILQKSHPVCESNHNQLDTSFGPNQSKSSPGSAKVGTPESGPDKSQRLDTSLATEENLQKSHPVCESNHNQLNTSFGPNQSKSSPGFTKGFAKVETPESGPDKSQRLDTSLATEEILPKSHPVCESNHNQLDASFGPNQSKSSPGFAKVETPESGPDKSPRLDTSLASEEILQKSHPVWESNHNHLDTSFGPNQSKISPCFAKIETPESSRSVTKFQVSSQISSPVVSAAHLNQTFETEKHPPSPASVKISSPDVSSDTLKKDIYEVSWNSEAGPVTAAEEIFKSPSAFDFLVQRGINNASSNLYKKSLFVKFDPLVNSPSQIENQISASLSMADEKDDKSRDEKCTSEALEVLIEKLQTAEKNEAKLKKDLMEKTKNKDSLGNILNEYEKTISQMVAQKEAWDAKLKSVENERDTTMQHLNNLEIAFNDVHQKYERSKAVIENLKKNEDILKASVQEYDTAIKKQENKYEMLKQHAKSQLDKANQELDVRTKSQENESAKLRALLKKSELKNSSLEQSLEQKIKENQELMKICDELINKVGQAS